MYLPSSSLYPPLESFGHCQTPFDVELQSANYFALDLAEPRYHSPHTTPRRNARSVDLAIPTPLDWQACVELSQGLARRCLCSGDVLVPAWPEEEGVLVEDVTARNYVLVQGGC